MSTLALLALRLLARHCLEKVGMPDGSMLHELTLYETGKAGHAVVTG